ncbi:protein D2 [Exaiptasia diaphana]|uniref:Phosphatidylethanolamine-binding protein n=1 Tax=Exaiptasia diaphana TaxID=2652724 RepID=A0A913XWE8_EXADI|nr:protein D2 [Exaiptasia diaphana]
MMDKRRKPYTIVQFAGFFVVLFSITSGNDAAGLIDKGCSSEFSRLDVRIDGQAIVCGNVYSLEKVGGSHIPEIQFSSASNTKKYTVVMIDPDAPSNSRPTQRSWLHYLAVNIEGSDIQNFVSLSDSLSSTVEYNPPTPPGGSGLHRYIIYVLQQSGSVNPGSFFQRGKFKIDKFVEDHSLTPVASNMFKTEQVE